MAFVSCFMRKAVSTREATAEIRADNRRYDKLWFLDRIAVSAKILAEAASPFLMNSATFFWAVASSLSIFLDSRSNDLEVN
eukprot:CAMPEP_0116855414 /NCGR_PEP_ID=MMETSP0418-20121206/19259_1 /TAXON_ID=1158023 /ORGANISM="Astrosyne radiata, Strain 13vi08-1A" /LENGTH=80 /DNA_ID=CAMNT_0004488533 /DNA_START=7 /DNA_END=246 /DNA_ORIENTATION=-